MSRDSTYSRTSITSRPAVPGTDATRSESGEPWPAPSADWMVNEVTDSYCGCTSVAGLTAKVKCVQISSAGMQESHVHDVQIVKEAPNYRAG